MRKMRKKKEVTKRNLASLGLALRTGSYAGKHHTRTHDLLKGRSRKQKHKGGEADGNY